MDAELMDRWRDSLAWKDCSRAAIFTKLVEPCCWTGAIEKRIGMVH